ncbi:MAG: HAD hydrolase-like protein [Candidatus Hydrogenedens sp.]|nr:HAD hydrolase-like protein [Candidatus Hydrogenedens sp.]
MSEERTFVPETEIEIIRDAPRGAFKHVLFDFDGTISLLREGWQDIMAPVCVEMICGDTEPTTEILDAVEAMIDETTGIQTIFQMERLVEMVKQYGLVPAAKVLDAPAYKQIYNDRLMVPVNERLAKLKSGALDREDVTVNGVHDFLERMKARGLAMYVFSGTDRDDVRNECEKVGAAPFFQEIWGALPSVEEYSKEKVIREIMAEHRLQGPEVLAIGDGPVELRNVKDAGGVAIGVCSDEQRGQGWDLQKRDRLIKAGADYLVADFGEAEQLVAYLFNEA